MAIALKALLGFAIVTAAEVAGLAGWLPLTESGHPLAGFAALVAGEAIEWSLLAFLIATSPVSVPLKEGRVRRAMAVTGLTSIIEAFLWVGWLALAGRVGLPFSMALLFVAMHLKHGVDMTVFAGRPYWSDLLSGPSLAASLWEVGGAGAWLALTPSGQSVLGISVLAGCISVEHFLQFRSAGILGPNIGRAAAARPGP